MLVLSNLNHTPNRKVVVRSVLTFGVNAAVAVGYTNSRKGERNYTTHTLYQLVAEIGKSEVNLPFVLAGHRRCILSYFPFSGHLMNLEYLSSVY